MIITLDARDASMLGFIGDISKKGIDNLVIWDRYLKMGESKFRKISFATGEYGSNAKKFLEEWNKNYDSGRRKRRDYVERNVQYMAREVARGDLNPAILTDYVKRYVKPTWR